HLETRCNGLGHGGCQASCLLFWKTEWLKPVEGPCGEAQTQPTIESSDVLVSACTQSSDSTGNEIRYRCQATRLPYATTDLKWWDPRQYVEDLTSGNVGIGRILAGAIYMTALALSRAGIGLGRPIRWLFDRFHALWGGAPFPRRTGTIPDGESTPVVTL